MRQIIAHVADVRFVAHNADGARRQRQGFVSMEIARVIRDKEAILYPGEARGGSGGLKHGVGSFIVRAFNSIVNDICGSTSPIVAATSRRRQPVGWEPRGQLLGLDVASVSVP